MRKVREVLRLKHSVKLSEREIAGSVRIGSSTVNGYVKRAKQAGLTWEEAERLSDAEVEARLFKQVGRNEPTARAPIDFSWVHTELRRVGVTLELLWGEYQEAVANGGSGQKPYQYSRFCELYRAYERKLSPVMRQTHRAGEKAFIDFSGKKPRLVNPDTGEEIEVELFVMALGASSYTYAEATRTQGLMDFVGATVRGLEYFGGVTEILVPDQLRSAVKTPDRYEPEINATYAEMGQHYGTAIVPARPRKPRDKAKVEAAVLLVQRWILACLRNRRFFTLEELNAAIGELVEKLNTKPFKKLEGCRRSVFEKLDRPALRPLPARRYELGEWKLGVGVNLDHHIEYDHRFYSVPCELISAKVDVRASATVIEVWRNSVRLTSHERSYGPRGTAVTKEEHRPRSHREWNGWPTERLVSWAATRGPKTGEVAAAILARGRHPESGRRACLGLVRLSEKHGSERVEAACGRALAIGQPTYKSVKAILKSGLEKVSLVEEVEPPKVVHENIRGGSYFDREEWNPESGDDEIEARYLEEERQSIINEPSSLPSRDTARSRGTVRREEASSQIVASGPREQHAVAPPPLLALIGRLQDIWSKPRPLERIGRPRAHQEGGHDWQWERSDDGLTGIIESACFGGGDSVDDEEVSRAQDCMYHETMCRYNDRQTEMSSPHGAEVS